MERLAEAGLSRQIGFRPPNWSSVLPALLETDMLSNMVPIALCDSPDWGKLQVFEAPLPLPQLTFRIFWSARTEGDPAQRWIREILIESFKAVYARADARMASADIIRPRG